MVFGQSRKSIWSACEDFVASITDVESYKKKSVLMVLQTLCKNQSMELHRQPTDRHKLAKKSIIRLACSNTKCHWMCLMLHFASRDIVKIMETNKTDLHHWQNAQNAVSVDLSKYFLRRIIKSNGTKSARYSALSEIFCPHGMPWIQRNHPYHTIDGAKCSLRCFRVNSILTI